MNLCSIRDIKPLLERHGFKFSRSMGQNFLIAEWVPEQIAMESLANEQVGVLEIGPGVGCLTQKLSTRAAKVVSVELDKKLLPVLKETLSNCPNTRVISGDILKTDIDALIAENFEGLSPYVCANLPYNITTDILTMLIDYGKFKYITVMVQREFAKRAAAKPGSKDYGAFSVYANYYTTPALLFDVPPECFIPAPKVTSSVIRFEMKPKSERPVCDEATFFKVVHGAFAQRRKTLLNSLSSSFSGKVTKEEIANILEESGYDNFTRGEQLSVEEFANLANKFESVLK